MKIVNLEEAKKEFINFSENYDLTIEPIKRKQEHSLRVMDISANIAKQEKFTTEEVDIGTLIGLLHDIARFRQYTEYKTFSDYISFDHGDVGVEIINKHNYLRKYIKTNKYDNIINTAIKNHNKYSIEEGITEKQNKFCKLVRDADKIDIIFQKTEKITDIEKEKIESSKLDYELKKEFDKEHIINRRQHTKPKGGVDKIIGVLALIFDINYKSSFEILYREDYVNKIIDRFEFKDEYTRKAMEEAKNKLNEYILRKLNK